MSVWGGFGQLMAPAPAAPAQPAQPAAPGFRAKLARIIADAVTHSSASLLRADALYAQAELEEMLANDA